MSPSQGREEKKNNTEKQNAAQPSGKLATIPDMGGGGEWTDFTINNTHLLGKMHNLQMCMYPVPWLAEEMLEGQRQRVDIPAHARSAHDGFLQKRLEGALC